ncbi:MAG: hypothetical protein ACREUG_11200 [Steroidobacteraceae bacterium]
MKQEEPGWITTPAAHVQRQSVGGPHAERADVTTGAAFERVQGLVSGRHH